jgi:hypothetical protein
MGMLRINLASLPCPHCSEPTALAGTARPNWSSGDDVLSFECARCGPFKVLAPAESGSEPGCDHHVARPGAELQDLWT